MRLFPPLIVLLCLGCSGPELVKVSGKLNNHGKPLENNSRRMMIIVFSPFEKGETFNTFPAVYDHEKATFAADGPAGKGIPVGKYRLSIQQSLPVMTPEVQRCNSIYTDAASPIIVDVQPGLAALEIDLAKPP